MIDSEITEMIVPRGIGGIVIVEDEALTSGRIREYILEKFIYKIDSMEDGGYIEKNIDVICVKNKTEWLTISSPQYYQHIIDLNLGGRLKEEEGINVLEELINIGAFFPPIIYTASDNLKSKTRCLDLGVKEKNFISKTRPNKDLPVLADSIEKNMLHVFFDNPDLNYYNQNRIEKNEVEDESLLQDSRSDNQGSEYLHLYENMDNLYSALLFSSKLAYCKFILSPWQKGYNYFLVQNHLLGGHAANNQVSDQKIIDRTWGCVYRNFDKHTKNIETITLLRGVEQKLILEFDNFDTLEAYIKDGKINSFEKNTFYRDITEIFAAKRLAEFCFDHITDDHLIGRAVEVGTHLAERLGKTELIFQLWELIVTSGNNQMASEASSMLKPFYDRGYPEIEDIFYCKVETIHEEDKLVQAIVMSLKDTEDVFPRGFDFDMLNKQYGINTQNATFKLIIYNNRENAVQRPGRAYSIEPVTPEIYYTRTTFS